jgi:hypothetical protein
VNPTWKQRDELVDVIHPVTMRWKPAVSPSEAATHRYSVTFEYSDRVGRIKASTCCVRRITTTG